MENEITCTQLLYWYVNVFDWLFFYSLFCSEVRILAELASRVTIRITLIYILLKTYNDKISCFVWDIYAFLVQSDWVELLGS